MEHLKTAMNICLFCQQAPGTVQFIGLPGRYCPTCALLARKHLQKPEPAREEKTWPELVAAELKD